jgi:hypothetical protein
MRITKARIPVALMFEIATALSSVGFQPASSVDDGWFAFLLEDDDSGWPAHQKRSWLVTLYRLEAYATLLCGLAREALKSSCRHAFAALLRWRRLLLDIIGLRYHIRRYSGFDTLNPRIGIWYPFNRTQILGSANYEF